jgi:hypothetical protein
MAAAAQKRGLDKTPMFDEQMRYARLQLLAQDLDDALKSQARALTPGDLRDYYAEHADSFEEASLARIFVPHAGPGAASTAQAAGSGSGASAQEMAQFAAALRARAFAGEDPDALQQEAYARAGLPPAASGTRLEKVRRAALPPSHEAVMDLPGGSVAQLISDPAGAHFIYKMIDKRQLAFEEVEPEIRAAIATRRYRDSLAAFQGDVAYSDAYFNPPSAQNPPAGARRSPKARSQGDATAAAEAVRK